MQEEETEQEGGLDIEALLNKLDPATEVTIVDVTGKETKLNAFVSARKQIRIFKKFKEISSKENLLSASDFTGTESIVEAIIKFASDESVAEDLGEIFTIAYPDLYDDPLDELPLEEMIGAIIPFCLRFLKKVGGGLTSIMNPAN